MYYRYIHIYNKQIQATGTCLSLIWLQLTLTITRGLVCICVVCVCVFTRKRWVASTCITASACTGGHVPNFQWCTLKNVHRWKAGSGLGTSLCTRAFSLYIVMCTLHMTGKRVIVYHVSSTAIVYRTSSTIYYYIAYSFTIIVVYQSSGEYPIKTTS